VSMNGRITTGAPAAHRRRRRVFWWFFLAVQLLFLVWIVAGATATAPACHDLTARACRDAADAGHGVAVAVQVAAWCVTDFLLAVVYGIYRLATRP
jgi:hypothetical protein